MAIFHLSYAIEEVVNGSFAPNKHRTDDRFRRW